MKPEPLIEKLKAVEEIFKKYNYYGDVKHALKSLGFELWGYTKSNGEDNLEEQIWVYKGILNNQDGQVLILVNWITRIAWIFEKKKVIDF